MVEQVYEGILAVFAKTAGIKLKIDGEESGWINPTDEARDGGLRRFDELKKLEGSEVLVHTVKDEKGSVRWSLIEKVDKVESENEQESVTPAVKSALNNLPKPKVTTSITPKPQISAQTSQESNNNTKTHYEGPIEKDAEKPAKQEEYAQIYNNLTKIKCETKKLEVPGREALTYVSWAEAWHKLKEKYEDAHYHVHNNQYTGMPYFSDHTGAFVKVSVTIGHITHTQYLPVLDNRNKAVEPKNINTFHINSSIQRCLVKAIAMHGLGLYVYKGEDIPEMNVEEEQIQ